MKPAIFHLGSAGVVTDPMELLRTAFMHSFTATAQQGKGMGNVTSMQYISGRYGDNPRELMLQLERQLTNYYTNFFPEGATVIAEEQDPGEDTRYTIRLGISVVSDGETYQLSEVLAIDPENTLSRIQDAL